MVSDGTPCNSCALGASKGARYMLNMQPVILKYIVDFWHLKQFFV